MKKSIVLIVILVLNWHSANAQQTILVPKEGRVYHGAQTMTFESGNDPLAGYLGALNDKTIQPAVRGIFISIPGERGPDKSLIGLKNFFHSADSIEFLPELNLFFVSNVATDSIIAVSNQYDWIIDSIITLSKNYGKKMFLRIGGEFNGAGPGWNGGGYHPYLYVTMFRKIVDMFTARGLRDSLAVNWCYEPDAANDFDSVDARGARWYPGDTYVDWFGLDLFDAEHFDQSLPDYSRGAITRKGKSERFLSMARTKGKPVYMSETSAKGVNISNDNNDAVNDWNNWFKKFWEFIDLHKEIKGFSYINANWPAGAYPNWGDARIQSSQYVTEKYKEEMRKPKYIHLGAMLATTVEHSDDRFLPNQISLFQNYPNPFNPSTTIQYSLPKRSFVTLKVFNTLGQEVAVLVNEEKQDGLYQVQWSANVPSGVYFYRLQAGSFNQTMKMLLLR
ncbi:MAG: T9SS type A sorting domain-containing protein [bacterium]